MSGNAVLVIEYCLMFAFILLTTFVLKFSARRMYKENRIFVDIIIILILSTSVVGILFSEIFNIPLEYRGYIILLLCIFSVIKPVLWPVVSINLRI